jgi:hypothetical protein
VFLEGNEIGEFTYSHALNANTLLENIMAASSSAFEQLQRQRESGKFSPDSAVASNDDGDTHQNNGLLNSSASTSGGSEAGSSSGSDVETKRYQDSLSPERRSSAQSDTSCETDNQQNDGGQNVNFMITIYLIFNFSVNKTRWIPPYSAAQRYYPTPKTSALWALWFVV